MSHGSQEYFLERSRFERRLSLIAACFSLLTVGAVWIFETSPLFESMRHTQVFEHFGFEGPERFVRRIELQADGESMDAIHQPVRPQFVPETHRGGGVKHVASRDVHAEPEPNRGIQGLGDSNAELLARALRRAGETPVFQSEELVIEQLVRPSYPEEARDKGIEGRVAVMALVDTLGRVINVDLINGNDGGLLERAASDAVWRCRFRPYRVAGDAREIYAVFRFNFRLRER